MLTHLRRCFPAVLASPNVLVSLEASAVSTYENAVNTLMQLQDHQLAEQPDGAIRLTLCTNRYHQRRALRTFRAAGRELGLTPTQLQLRSAPIPASLAVAAQRSLTACPAASPLASGVASASSTRSYSVWETAAMAFDSSAQSYWQAGGVAPQWLRLVADNAGEEICGYQMTVRREHCCAAAHSPARWQLLSARLGARDDGWSVLHEGSQASWIAGETREFQLASPASVDQVQLNILATVADRAVCAPGANGTEAYRGRHRCAQDTWWDWLSRGGAGDARPVIAGLSFVRCPDASVKSATLPADDGASLEEAAAGDVKAWLAELTVELAREVLATVYYTAMGRISLWEEVE